MLTLLFLILTIVLILIAITYWKIHPFLTLLLAAIAMGLLAGLDTGNILKYLTEGFGNTLKSIGIVIACGTIIGTALEQSGGANALASSVLRLVGKSRSPLAMNITGFIVSVPVFCDSGFVILSPLNRALSKNTGVSMTVLAVALASGLYATHVFVPPTPGPLAAAATIGADIGLVIIYGLIVAIPTAAAGLIWAQTYAKKFKILPRDSVTEDKAGHSEKRPATIKALAPLLVPIFLITFKSIAEYPGAPLGGGMFKEIVTFIGHPVSALMIGVFIAFALLRNPGSGSQFAWVSDGLKNAGVIILITGAGGAFGAVLRATDIGANMGELMSQWQVGIILPFIIAAVLKSAQGSSTVAIITTAALVSPLLEPLGLSSPVALALVVLAIGAGSMTVSHLNDSYFWVIAQFSGMETPIALRCHTLASLVQGITAICIILILKWMLV